MNIELMLLEDSDGDETLGFSFWKRNLKTMDDKKKIVSMIHHLYHMQCIESSMDVEHLDEILEDISYSKVGFVMDVNPSNQNYALYAYNANKK
ncbi:hypothetical protein [Priestia megaterium]|uniref:hypothetical protein n=1 Tax=Priestia megaterium TaxID=1404 RepID=UPI002E2164A8|nr:hypothetical protein [Priestia megaterium]